jgi:hypothetical protein
MWNFNVWDAMGFTPHGLFQHLSRSQDACCCHIITTSQSQLVSAPFPHMASPPALSPIWAPHTADEDMLGNGYGEEFWGDSNDSPDLGANVTVDEFTTTYVTTHAAISSMIFR